MFEESPFSGACAASTWEVLVMLTGSILLGVLLGYLIWGWLKGRVQMLEKKLESLQHVNQLKDSQIESLTSRVSVLEEEQNALNMEIRTKDARFAQATGRITELTGEVARLREKLESAPEEPSGQETPWSQEQPPSQTVTTAPAQEEGISETSLILAAQIFEKPVSADDLTLIEGIGPKIAELFQGQGIDSWSALAESSAGELRRILNEAGPQYQMHDPETWPRQAQMAASGEWKKLKAYQGVLRRGRE